MNTTTVQPTPTATPVSTLEAAHGPERRVSVRSDELIAAYLPTGGVATGDELARLRASRYERSVSTIARWIVRRQVVSFTSQGDIFLPLFQFDPTTFDIRSGIESVLSELRDVYDDAEVAAWFVRPNSSLDDSLPQAVLPRDALRVVEAARADRFAILG